MWLIKAEVSREGQINNLMLLDDIIRAAWRPHKVSTNPPKGQIACCEGNIATPNALLRTITTTMKDFQSHSSASSWPPLSVHDHTNGRKRQKTTRFQALSCALYGLLLSRIVWVGEAGVTLLRTSPSEATHMLELVYWLGELQLECATPPLDMTNWHLLLLMFHTGSQGAWFLSLSNLCQSHLSNKSQLQGHMPTVIKTKEEEAAEELAFWANGKLLAPSINVLP